MTRSPQHPSGPDQRRTRITLAAITGLFAGAIRAVVDWLITHVGA
ncbi:hypothetical protein ACIBSW_24715 [Actinoplanes sp. NPDC049668]